MVLPEPSQTMAYTPRKTVYRLARKQLYLKLSFDSQSFPILTNSSRVWHVNHLYHYPIELIGSEQNQKRETHCLSRMQ